jgi:pimeloyl-ACP methyl ester carboxylesterase
LFEHDFSEKPVPTFPEHALTAGSTANNTGFSTDDKARAVAGLIWQPYRGPVVPRTKSLKRGGKAMPSSRTISANGIEIFLLEQGEGPLVVLCHGWPELSYSWRHQISAIANAGFHVVAPDMRGFGRTSAPSDVNAYSIFDHVGDMVGLVAALGEKQALIIGHDWGAPVAWHAAMFRPDIFTAVAGLSVPPPFRGRGRPLDSLRENGITNFYWQYFQTPGVAEREFERDVDMTMRVLLGRGFSDPSASLFIEDGKGFLGDNNIVMPLPDWLSEADLSDFSEAYKRSGFRGGLNWYRNIDRNWELTAPWQDARIVQPSLFIAGARDSVITGLMGGKRIAEMERILPGLKQKLIIEGAGHWIQQERPDEVNAALIAFLRQNSSSAVATGSAQ